METDSLTMPAAHTRRHAWHYMRRSIETAKQIAIPMLRWLLNGQMLVTGAHPAVDPSCPDHVIVRARPR